MSEPSNLYWDVLGRLVEVVDTNGWASLVEAAFEGPDLIEAAFGHVMERPSGTAPTKPEPIETWLTRIEIEGFRGIGPAAVIDLPPGPGLTVIKGRNGTGKSSFAEGLEVALTGTLKRIESRATEWQGGWRNLHHDRAKVTARLSNQGAGVTQITRTWNPEQSLGGGALTVTRAGVATDLAALGWHDAFKTHWPILSYGELGGLLEKGPSHLFDALKGLLGLDELNDVQGRLATARKTRERVIDAIKDDAKALGRELTAIDDERARRCQQAISGNKWQLDVIEDVALGVQVDERLNQLEALMHLDVPDPSKSAAAITRLIAAAEARAALAETDDARRQATAELLEHALKWHERRTDDTCPLCGIGSLDETWRERTKATLTAEHDAVRGARTILTELKDAYAEAKRFCTTVPHPLSRLVELELPTNLAEAWQTLATTPPADHGAKALADHLRTATAAVHLAHHQLMALVKDRLNEVERRWAPIASKLVAWHDRARGYDVKRQQVKLLKDAEAWLKGVEADLREQRFSPIAEQAQTVWKELRQESSISLASIKLMGTATKRKVELDVTIDGKEAAALGVMSQGELNALSLSLFIPRLAHEESPFRFVVIDDPVQAMDPFKVDGLAMVLRDLAKTRQVIVLTHDTRLPDALRRMQVSATTYEVVRKTKSSCEVQLVSDPAKALIDEARSLAMAERDIGKEVTMEVVPVLCRAAFEETLTAMIKRRILGRGDGHERLRERLGSATSTTKLAALALFDNAELGKDVMPLLGRKPRLVDAYKAIREGSHETYHGDAHELCRATEELIGFVQTVKP